MSQRGDYEILNGLCTPRSGMLRTLFAIRFKCNKALSEEQKQAAFECLNIIAEDTSVDNEIRSFCYNELGLIYSQRSDFLCA